MRNVCIHCGQAALFAHRGDPVCPDCSGEGYEGRPAASSCDCGKIMPAPSDQEKLVGELKWAAEMVSRQPWECALGASEATRKQERCGHCTDNTMACYKLGRLKDALKPLHAGSMEVANLTRARQPGAASSETQWQPIETAPRDGTWLLIYGNVWAGEISGIARNAKGDVAIARYSDGKSDFPGDWWDEAGGNVYACWCQPTHWMPLPEAPVSQIGGAS